MKRLSALLLFVLSVSAFAQQPTYDYLIRNGQVVDGTGNPWRQVDIGIVGDRIAFMGNAGPNVTAKRVIDAKGLVVAPGFIDMLGQSEINVLIDPQAFSKLTQGITTEVTGEGESVAPVNDAIIAEGKDYLEHFKLTIDFRSLDEYFNRLNKQGAGVNIATFVGATEVRKMVLANANRPPTPDELRQMEDLVDDAMREGALGLSSSLIYAPAFYASTDELLALAKVAARHNGVYASHIRNEGDDEMTALDEAFRIGREAGLPVEIWHLKVSGRHNWGKMRGVVEKIAAARAEGLDVTADQYPYIASATALSAVIPPDWHEGGADALIARLKDPQQRAKLKAEMTSGGRGENMWRGVGTPDGILIASVLNPELKQYEGKTLADIAKSQNKDALDALFDFIIADHYNTGAVYFTMSEDDVRLAMQQPWVAFDCDAGSKNLTGPLSESRSHPRAWGTMARVLGRYVREEKVLRLEEAIRKMTSLPAQRVKLTDRGVLRNGAFADITIFDPAKVTDVATFENPNQQSRGFAFVFVNGVLSLENDKPTGKLGGRGLRGPGYTGRNISPEGLPVRGKIQGIVTDAGGWPVLRATVTLLGADGKPQATATTGKDGRYEFARDTECALCRVTVERPGFITQKRDVDYNGANSLWFSFVLKRTP